MSNLFYRARLGDISILSDPQVDKDKDCADFTPLHYLAWKGWVEVLQHPSVDKVKNSFKVTPLHCLALTGTAEILNHLSVDKVKDVDGHTPLHYLASKLALNYIEDINENTLRIWLKKKYPWYKKKIPHITISLIDEILNTPNFMRFINE